MNRTPIERIVAAGIPGVHGRNWWRMQRKERRRVRRVVLVIAGDGKETRSPHQRGVDTEMVVRKLLEGTGLISDIAGMNHEVRLLCHHLEGHRELVRAAVSAIAVDQETERRRAGGLEAIIRLGRDIHAGHDHLIRVRGSGGQARQVGLILVKRKRHTGLRGLKHACQARRAGLRKAGIGRVADHRRLVFLCRPDDGDVVGLKILEIGAMDESGCRKHLRQEGARPADQP